MKVLNIIWSVLVVVLCAAVLAISLPGCGAGVPVELKGTWYEVNGYGYIEFNPGGEMNMTALGFRTSGRYTFDNNNDQGTIIYDEEESTFTCDGITLEWEDSILTKTYVDQIEYDWDEMFNQLN